MINVEFNLDEFDVLTEVIYLFKQNNLHYKLSSYKLAYLSNLLYKLDESYERRSLDD